MSCMRITSAIFFLSFCFFSCNERRVPDQGPRPPKDTVSAVLKNATVSNKAARVCYAERAHLELPDYFISLVAQYMFPLDSLQHDSSQYLKGSFLTARRKSGKTIDSVHLDIGDLSNCYTCNMILRNLTDTLQIKPLFIQLVTQGEDLTDNTFIGYRSGKLQELFHLGDTEEKGVKLQRT